MSEAPEISRVWHFLQETYTEFGSATYKVNRSGESNYILIVDVPQNGEQYLLKIPRRQKHGRYDDAIHEVDEDANVFLSIQAARQNVLFEAFCTQETYNIFASKELTTPEVLDISPGGNTTYLMLRPVPGEALPLTTVQHFDARQLQNLGSRIADFVYHLGGGFSVKTYHAVRDFLPRAFIPDRGRWIRDFPTDIDDPTFSVLYPTLTRIIRDIGQKLVHSLAYPMGQQYEIIGHDDLRPGNLIFHHNHVTGIIDFGNVQESSPEREFRHLRVLGEAAVEAAVERYHTLTGYECSPSLLHLWSLGQAATSMANLLYHGLPPRPRQLELMLREFPDEDWSEALL